MRHTLAAGIAVVTLLLGILIGTFAFAERHVDSTASPAPSKVGAEPVAGAAQGGDIGPAPETLSLDPATYDFGSMLEGEWRTTDLALRRPEGTKLRIRLTRGPIRGAVSIETSCPAHRTISIPVDGTAR